MNDKAEVSYDCHYRLHAGLDAKQTTDWGKICASPQRTPEDHLLYVYEHKRGEFRSTREIATWCNWPMAKTRRFLWRLVEQGHVTCYDGGNENLWKMDGPRPRAD